MPRRKAGDGPVAPKMPRVRKKKVPAEEQKPPDAYDPLMHANGGYPPMDDGMYSQDAYGGYGAFAPTPGGAGAPVPFGSPEPSSSPYILPQQSNTPQPQMMMRQMAPPPQPSQTSMGPAPSPLEFRIHEMNRRLYIFSNSGFQVNEKDCAQWWDAFSHEFFDDDAHITFYMNEEPGNPAHERYAINRHAIPRFFRSIFDGGMKELCYVIRGSSRETPTPSGTIQFENENVLQVTKTDAPLHYEVNTESKLSVEFTPYDEVLNHRIRNWTLELRTCDEFYFNDTTKEFDRMDLIAHPERKLTRMGFPKTTITLLGMSRVLEPMQVIMSHSKASGHDPRDTMKRTIFQHFQFERQREIAIRSQQQMMPPAPEEKPKPVRKRQRKAPATNAKKAKANASPAPTNPAFPTNPMNQGFSAMGYQDVMVVGEPSMMGGDFGEEDERTISRVENTQYDPNGMQMQQLGQPMGGPSTMQMGPPMVPPMAPPPNPMGVPPNQMGVPPNQMGVPNPMQPPMTTMPTAMPPGYGFQPQATWPNQPNTTMITG